MILLAHFDDPIVHYFAQAIRPVANDPTPVPVGEIDSLGLFREGLRLLHLVGSLI